MSLFRSWQSFQDSRVTPQTDTDRQTVAWQKVCNCFKTYKSCLWCLSACICVCGCVNLELVTGEGFSLWIMCMWFRNKQHIMLSRCGLTKHHNVFLFLPILSSLSFCHPLSTNSTSVLVICLVAGSPEGGAQGNVRRPGVWILPVSWWYPIGLGAYFSHQTACQKPAPVWIQSSRYPCTMWWAQFLIQPPPLHHHVLPFICSWSALI